MQNKLAECVAVCVVSVPARYERVNTTSGANDMAEEIQINTAVTPSLHPAVIDKIVEEFGEDVADHIAPVRGWFNSVYSSLSDLDNAKAKGMADKTQTQASVIVKLSGFAGKIQDQALQRADALNKRL